jgi:hypothetical protein
MVLRSVLIALSSGTCPALAYVVQPEKFKNTLLEGVFINCFLKVADPYSLT